jgi:hypothetical protein
MLTSSGSRDRSCSFEGCGRPFRARGLCSSHLDQLARGKPLTPIRVWKTTCEFPGCDNKHAGSGLCRSHKSQLQRGQPLQRIGAGFKFAWRDRQGHVHIKAPEGHPNARKNGYIFVADLVSWAREILARYGDLFPAPDGEAANAGVLPSDCRRLQRSAQHLPP